MNMKRILCALLACTIGVVSASALAGCGCSNNKGKNQESKSGYEVVATQPDLKDDTFGFYILNDTDLMITKYYGSLSDVVIPDTYKNYTVTTIGHSVFDNDGIKTVVVPDTVTDIQDYAFASNKNMTSIKLPANLEHLGTNAFFYCMSLEVHVPSVPEPAGGNHSRDGDKHRQERLQRVPREPCSQGDGGLLCRDVRAGAQHQLRDRRLIL